MIGGADADAADPSVASEHLIVKADRRYVRIHIPDIRFVEGMKDYVIIHLPDKKIVTRMTIKGVEEMLPTPRFMRVNKSYIVNTDYVDSFDNNDIYIGTQEIAIGQQYRETVMQQLR